MKFRIMSVLFIFFLSLGNVFAAGLNNDYIGLRATGMANIYTGVADDASAIYWNPAGLVQIPEGPIDYNAELYTGIFPDFTYHRAVDGKHYETTTPFGAPNMFAAMKKGKLAFGGGLYAAYGSGTVILEDVPKYGDLTVSMGLFALGLSIAYEVSPNLSIGLTGETAIGKQDVEMDRLYQQRGTAEYYVDLKQKMLAAGTGYRGLLGIMYKPVSDLRFGFVAKTPTTLDFDGDMEIVVVDGGTAGLPSGYRIAYDPSASYTTKTPWFFLTGASYQVTPKMLATVEYAYRKWGDVDFTETEFQSAQGKVQSWSKTNYIDNWTVGGGLKYKLSPIWTTSAGVSYTTHAVDSENKSVAAGGSDVTYYNFAAGVGCKITKRVELVCNFYYYLSDKEYDPYRNSYQKTLWGNIIGVKGSW